MSGRAHGSEGSPRPKPRLRLLWLTIFATFCLASPLLVLLVHHDGERLNFGTLTEYAGNFGSIGAGVATCTILGLAISAEVRSGRLTRKRAYPYLLGLPVLCALTTLLVVFAFYQVLPRNWAGEFAILSLLYMPLWSLVGSTAIALAIGLRIAKRKEAEKVKP